MGISNSEPDLRTQAGRLQWARARLFSSRRGAANANGWNENTYKSHEGGIRREGALSEDDARKYARAFGVSLPWLMTGRGDPLASTGRRTVPLVGYVGAGAEAHYHEPADMGEVDAPDNATPQTVAALIRGTSLGPLFDGWLIFYDDVRDPVTTDQIGELCIVGLADGKVLVKRLRHATADKYHLESNAEPTMYDQQVAWAARVKGMTPR